MFMTNKYLQKMVDSMLLLHVIEIRLRSTIAGLLFTSAVKTFQTHINMEFYSSVKSIKC